MKQAILAELKKGPGHDLHDFIVQQIRERLLLSYQVMQSRYEDWKKIDYHMMMAVDKTEKDDEGQVLLPFQRSLLIPHTFAQIESMAISIYSYVMGRTPFWPLEGRGPEDVDPAYYMTMVGEYQREKAGMAAEVEQCIENGLKYGIGALKNLYVIEERERVLQTRYEIAPGIPPIIIPETRKVVRYEGNKLQCIDSYDLYPDLRLPIARYQEGEFFGIRDRRHENYLHRLQSQGKAFNVEKIADAGFAASTYDWGDWDESGRAEALNMSTPYDTPQQQKVKPEKSGIVRIEEMWLDAIPSELFDDTSLSDQPQIFLFQIANGRTLIYADESPVAEFPFYLFLPNVDMHAPLTKGPAEMYKGLQDWQNWLISSRADEVMRRLNGRPVLDASRIDLDSFYENAPGTPILVTEDSYGQDVRTAFYMPDVPDTTRGNIGDLEHAFTVMQRIYGTSNPFMGMPQGGRKTKGENDALLRQSGGRVSHLGDRFWNQGLYWLIRAQVENTQEFMQEARFYRIIGDWPDARGSFGHIKVGPDELAGDFDIAINLQAISADPVAVANAIRQLIETLVKSPPGTFDPFEMTPLLIRAYELLGIRNLGRYRRAPAPQIQQGIQQGNMMPVGRPPGPRPAPGPQAPPPQMGGGMPMMPMPPMPGGMANG